MAEPVVDEVIEKEETPVVEPVVEEELETETEEEEDEEAEEGDEEEEETPEPISRRKALRIQSLIEKLNGGDSRTAPTPKAGLDYAKALDTDEATAKALEDDRTSYGDARYQSGVDQARSIQFHTRLEIDGPRVSSKFPQFDKDSAQFNPVATDAINRMYLSTVGYDDKTDTVKSAAVRYFDYVESIMELADEMAGQKVATSKKNITRQAAKTGLRPGSNTPKRLNLNQSPKAMTDEELKAIIARDLG
jgi:hypothetical protein